MPKYYYTVAQRYPAILVTGFADNSVLLGPGATPDSRTPAQAATNAASDFKAIKQEANMQANTSESHLHVPQWATQNQSALAAQAQFSHSGSHNELLFRLDGGNAIPLVFLCARSNIRPHCSRCPFPSPHLKVLGSATKGHARYRDLRAALGNPQDKRHIR